MKTLVAIFFAVPLVFIAACGDDGAGPKDAAADGPPGDAGTPDADCFMNPQTHEEIINACTTAQKITKNPTLPLLNADGSLPPLPP
ncbi:MAG: hypothetical protein AB7T06_15440 [Kofleriaceae bacterium]